MDPIIEQIVLFLTPLLPYLVTGGKTISQGLLEEIGADVYHSGKLIWKKITAKKTGPSIEIVKLAEAYIENHEISNFDGNLKDQLEKVLLENPNLIATIGNLLPDVKTINKVKIKVEDSVRTKISINNAKDSNNSVKVNNSCETTIDINN